MKDKILELNLELDGQKKPVIKINNPHGGAWGYKKDNNQPGRPKATKEQVEHKKNKNNQPDPSHVNVEVIPSLVYTHTGSDCITFVIGGSQYTYCWGP